MLTSLHRNRDNTDHEFEYIVIDDGSTDSTPAVIKEFSERSPLRVVRHETPVGLASARNVGLDAARGKYLTFLDGDDWIGRDYLTQAISAIDSLGCDFVRFDHVQVRERERVLHRAPEPRRDAVLDPRAGILPAWRRSMVDYPYAWAGIYRRDLGEILRFEDGLHTAEDRPWIWRLHQQASSYAVVSLAGVFYRRLVANSLTQIGDERQLHFLDAFIKVLEGVADEPDLQPKAIRQFLAVLAHQIQTGSRFTFAHRRQMRSRARAILATVPPQALMEAMPVDGRSDILWPLLPAAAKRVRQAV